MTVRIVEDRCEIIERAGDKIQARVVRVATTRPNVGGVTVHADLTDKDQHDHPLYVRHVDFTGPAGGLAKLADESYGTVKIVKDEANAPTAANDFTQGYAVNSWWFTTAKTAHVCAFAGILGGDAVWIKLGATGYDVEVATIAELYAAVNAGGLDVAQGNSWHITGTADADAERSGFFDPDGTIEGSIDGLFPHPFTELFPINSATMEIGLAVDGKVEAVLRPLQISLNVGCLTMQHVGATIEGSIVQMPGIVNRPGDLSMVCEIRQTGGTAASQVVSIVWARTLGLPQEDSHGPFAFNALADASFQARASKTTNDVPVVSAAAAARVISGILSVIGGASVPGASGAPYTAYSRGHPQGGPNVSSRSILANNGMSLNDPTEFFVPWIKAWATVATDDFELDVIAIKFSSIGHMT